MHIAANRLHPSNFAKKDVERFVPEDMKQQHVPSVVEQFWDDWCDPVHAKMNTVMNNT